MAHDAAAQHKLNKKNNTLALKIDKHNRTGAKTAHDKALKLKKQK